MLGCCCCNCGHVGFSSCPACCSCLVRNNTGVVGRGGVQRCCPLPVQLLNIVAGVVMRQGHSAGRQQLQACAMMYTGNQSSLLNTAVARCNQRYCCCCFCSKTTRPAHLLLAADWFLRMLLLGWLQQALQLNQLAHQQRPCRQAGHTGPVTCRGCRGDQQPLHRQ